MLDGILPDRFAQLLPSEVPLRLAGSAAGRGFILFFGIRRTFLAKPQLFMGELECFEDESVGVEFIGLWRFKSFVSGCAGSSCGMMRGGSFRLNSFARLGAMAILFTS